MSKGRQKPARKSRNPGGKKWVNRPHPQPPKIPDEVLAALGDDEETASLLTPLEPLTDEVIADLLEQGQWKRPDCHNHAS